MLKALDTLSVPAAKPEAQKEGPSVSVQLPSVVFRREGTSDSLVLGGEGLGTAERSNTERREKIRVARREKTTNVDILDILGEINAGQFMKAKLESSPKIKKERLKRAAKYL